MESDVWGVTEWIPTLHTATHQGVLADSTLVPPTRDRSRRLRNDCAYTTSLVNELCAMYPRAAASGETHERSQVGQASTSVHHEALPDLGQDLLAQIPSAAADTSCEQQGTERESCTARLHCHLRGGGRGKGSGEVSPGLLLKVVRSVRPQLTHAQVKALAAGSPKLVKAVLRKDNETQILSLVLEEEKRLGISAKWGQVSEAPESRDNTWSTAPESCDNTWSTVQRKRGRTNLQEAAP
eukprot:4688713-Amphidinium_carterae.2